MNSASNISAKSILLVEDDPFLIDIYSIKLKEAGFGVRVASHGEEALQKIKEELPDILLLDIVLPRADGWEIIGQIKALKSAENLKIVILSNLGQKSDVEKGLKLGAVKYLIKAHYTPTQVVEEIRDL